MSHRAGDAQSGGQWVRQWGFTVGVLVACDLALGGWEAADLEDPRRRKPVTPLAEPAGEKMRKEKTHKPGANPI